MSLKVRMNDVVKVICGKERGKIGKIKKILTKKNKVVIEGINYVVKHKKSRLYKIKGSLIKVEAPIHISNISYYCVKLKKDFKIGFICENNQKKRIFRKNNLFIK